VSPTPYPQPPVWGSHPPPARTGAAPPAQGPRVGCPRAPRGLLEQWDPPKQLLPRTPGVPLPPHAGTFTPDPTLALHQLLGKTPSGGEEPNPRLLEMCLSAAVGRDRSRWVSWRCPHVSTPIPPQGCPFPVSSTPAAFALWDRTQPSGEEDAKVLYLHALPPPEQAAKPGRESTEPT